MATLIYDGNCGLCTACVLWLQRTLGRVPSCVPSQACDPGAFGLTAQDVQERVWFVTQHARFGGHEAVAALLRTQAEWPWRFLGQVLVTPPFAWGARLGYRLVAANRHRIRVGNQQCAVPAASLD